MSDWETQTDGLGEWKPPRPKRSTAQIFLIVTVAVVAAGVCGRLAWQALHAARESGESAGRQGAAPASAGAIPWQRDALASLDDAAREVASGNLSAAEVAVDKSDSIVTNARLGANKAQPEFFLLALAGLDRVWNQRPGDDTLFTHVTQARIDLAALRSAQNGAAGGSASEDNSIVYPPPPATAGASGGAQAVQPNGAEAARQPAERRVSVATPRSVAKNSTLKPATLGGNYLDATQMADAAEILLPPPSRSLDDNVRVEGLTIAGASQTLDGIRWSNVTFVGTRLRYENGELELKNVRFVHCTFGFPSNDRGARLADAIARGETSFSSQ